jgi:hypothetical protein
MLREQFTLVKFWNINQEDVVLSKVYNLTAKKMYAKYVLNWQIAVD